MLYDKAKKRHKEKNNKMDQYFAIESHCDILSHHTTTIIASCAELHAKANHSICLKKIGNAYHYRKSSHHSIPESRYERSMYNSSNRHSFKSTESISRVRTKTYFQEKDQCKKSYSQWYLDKHHQSNQRYPY